MKKYRIWEKITDTGVIVLENEAQIISVEDVKDANSGKEYQKVTYIIPEPK